MQRDIKLGLVGVAFTAMIMTGCGSNNDKNEEENNAMSDRFTLVEKSGDTVERDNEANLEWIGSAGMGACSPNGAATTQEADVAAAKAHCETLVFAGHDDWRVATAQENADHIQGMQDAGMTPFYQNAGCPRLIGVDASDNASAVNTHNASPAGNMTPWATLITQGASNYGVKCVRDL